MSDTIDSTAEVVSETTQPIEMGVSPDVVTITAPASTFQLLPWLIIGGLVLWYLKDGVDKGEELW
jgi:hypothetical protein